MLVIFLPIFVADTKIIFDYNSGAPLRKNRRQKKMVDRNTTVNIQT